MAKKAKTTAQPPVGTRATRHKSRAEREAEINRIVVIATGIIAAVIIIILAFALGIDGLIRPNQIVASAGSRTLTARDFENRVRFERWQTGLQLRPIANTQFAQQVFTNAQFGGIYAELYQALQSPLQFGQRVLNQSIDDMVISQYAAANGITVSPDEIDKEFFALFAFQPTPMTETPSPTPTLTLTPLVSATPTSTPTATITPTITATPAPPTLTPIPTGLPTATPGPTERAKTFQDNSKNYYDEGAKLGGYSEAEIRRIFEQEALRKKVEKAVLGDAPKEEVQVRVRHILVRTPEAAEQALAALRAGEPFAAVAAAVSQDENSKNNGGDLGWIGNYVKGTSSYTTSAEFMDVIQAAQVGAVIGPIDTTTSGPEFGYHIIQVMARETRQLTNDQSDDAQAQRFDAWLNEQRANFNAQTYATWFEWVPEDPTLAQLGLPQY